MIHLLKPLNIPIMATGGISDFFTLKAALNAGARLVGMATAIAINPYIIPLMNKALKKHR